MRRRGKRKSSASRRRVALYLVLILAACGFLRLPPSWYSKLEQYRSAGAVRVLFIGNSFTFGNDLPWLVEQLSAGAVSAQECAEPGYSLEQHWNEQRARRLIAEGRWRWVVLQDQSRMPLDRPQTNIEFAGRFAAEIRRNDAFAALFMTWIDRDRPDEYQALDFQYLQLGNSVPAVIVPVGRIFRRIMQEHPELDLYAPDGHHASLLGSYAAAMAFVGVFTGTVPEITSTDIALPPRDIRHLVAPETVKVADRAALEYIRQAVAAENPRILP